MPQKRRLLNRSCYGQIDANSRPCSAERAELLDRASIKMIVSNQLPLSFISSTGFRDFMKLVEPNYKVPCEVTFKNRLMLVYDDVCMRIKAELNAALSVSFSTDCWTSRSEDSYITVNVHFVNDKWEGKFYNLSTMVMKEAHTSANLATEINSIINDWELTDKAMAVVTDNAANILGALKNIDTEVKSGISCAAHTLQLSIKEGLNAPTIHRICCTVKKIVSLFHHSYKASNALEEQQRALGLSVLKLIQSCPTRWNSVYSMLDRLLLNRVPVENVLANRKIVSRATAEQLEITEREWTFISELIIVLKPLQVATTVLCSNSHTPISIVNPVIRSLIDIHLSYIDSDCESIRKLKDTISADLQRRFVLNRENIDFDEIPTPRQIVQFLDPRYKNLENEPAETRQIIRTHIKKLCEQYVTNNNDSNNLPVSNSALDFLFGMQPNNRDINMQFELYVAEPQIIHNYDIFKWWKSNEKRFPTIALLARKFLGIPSTSAGAERIFSTAGNIVTAKRSSLLPENVNVLVFLFQNRHLLQLQKDTLENK